MQKKSAQAGNAVLIAVVVIAVLGVVGFFLVKSGKQSSNSSNNSFKQTSPGSQTNNSGTVSEDLTFSGAVSGHMSQGSKGDTYVCTAITTGPIVGKIGDTDYTFEYRALNAKGPGPVKGYVQIGPVNNKDLYYGGDNVDLTINADKRSGSVNGDLSNLKNSAQTVHISGNWTCPPDY